MPPAHTAGSKAALRSAIEDKQIHPHGVQVRNRKILIQEFRRLPQSLGEIA